MSTGWYILIVEDDPASSSVLQYILNYNGAKVDIAANGEQALQHLKQRLYDLAIVDMNLPQMSGWSLLDNIKKNAAMAQQRCIALTAYYDPKVALEAERAGFEACFPKPVEPSFIETLKQILAAE
jgi:CheY-like chemotaxis protein